MNGLEALDELQISTVSHNTVNTKTDRHKLTCHHCKRPGHYRYQCRLLKRQKEQSEDTQSNPGKKTVAPITLSQTTIQTRTTTTTKTVTELKESHKLLVHPVRIVEKQTTPQRNATMDPMQSIDRFSGKEDRQDRIRSKKKPIKMTQMKLLRFSPNFELKMPRLHSGAAIDRPETTKLPPIPEVVWQQPQETQ